MHFPSSNYGNNGREYADILQFARAHDNVTYDEFDEFILRDVNLFDIPKDEYFDVIEQILDKIIKALPSLKRIFSRPIVRLKDTQEIVPVENAHIINGETLAHLSLHTELWADVGDEGVVPKKLMTVGRAETYRIYENLVFAGVIDGLFKYLRRIEVLLRDVLYDCSDIHFNFLDRTHHSHFFLAIGKLHIEYIRAQQHQYSTYARCVDKIAFIERTLGAKLRSPVYVHCKKNRKKLTLKKTNIFRVHKDYKVVYEIAKWMEEDIEIGNMSDEVNDGVGSGEEYKAFCIFLSIFAAGHYNFRFEKNARFSFSKFDSKCSFLDWKMSISEKKTEGVDCLVYKFNKDKIYSVCLILKDPEELTQSELSLLKEKMRCDEYLFASSVLYGEKDVVYLSLYNVDSFRRLQQIMLRGMIYSDTQHKVCPFCGHGLKEKNGVIECDVCRSELIRCVCPEGGEEYYVSGIREYKANLRLSDDRSDRRRFLHDRYTEAQLHFRNITPISSDGHPICPKCGKKHI